MKNAVQLQPPMHKKGAWFVDKECSGKEKGSWFLRYYGEA